MKGLTQEEVADKLNLSVNGYGKIERGNCDINLHRLEQIAEVFGIEVIELLGTTDTNLFNLSFSSSCTNYCTNNMDTQNNHNYSTFENSELKSELEKQQLIIQLKDKEIELRDEKIRHLTEVIELLKAKASL